VHPSGKEVVQELLLQNGYGAFVNPIGRFVQQSDKVLIVKA
jgi:hypothetical protein